MKNLTNAVIFCLCILGIACTSKPKTKSISHSSTTAFGIFSEVEQFAKEAYPNAVFFGFNNHGPSVYRDNRMPETPDKNGVLSYWFYLFAKTPEALADKHVANDEAFGVLFRNGKLQLVKEVLTNFSCDEKAPIGRKAFAFDTDTLFENVVEKTKQEFTDEFPVPFIGHVNFNCSPALCEVTLFLNPKEGFDVEVKPTTGAINHTRSVFFD